MIADRLRREAGLKPFLDRWHLVPGMPWQDELADALERSSTVAVFVGESGVNPWHNEEMRVALDRAVRSHDEFRVIPVLLPGANPSALPKFLSQRTWVDFQRGLEDTPALQRLVAGVRGEAVVDGGYELPDRPAPYRGLLRFEADDADLFFGRDADTRRLVERLETGRFVAVVGASGSGKSSLVRAGLLPALARGAIPGSDSWRTLVFTPGSDPMRGLAEQIATLDLRGDRLTLVDELAARFAERRDGLRTAIRALSADDPLPVLIVVDQFTEVFTLRTGSPTGMQLEAERLVAALADAVEDPATRCRVVVTLRADFVERALASSRLRELMENGQVLLGALSPEALREVIVRPAQAVGAFLEKGVVRAILNDVSDEPGGLPLLQHALYELWRRRRGPWLTLDAYEQSGGVAGALRRRAQATYESLTPVQQELARTVFLRLATIREDVVVTRRRVGRSELYPADIDASNVDAVLQSLSDERARLLVVDETTVEVAHEALLKQWHTLRGWLDDNREALRTHRRLTVATEEWIKLGRDPGSLYRGAKLAEAEEWSTTHGGDLNAAEEEFLETSRQQARQELEEERARTRRLRRRLVSALAALMIALAGAGGALWALQRATTAEAEAADRASEAELLAHEARRGELAAKLHAFALKIAPSDPTAAIRVLEKAIELPRTPAITQTLLDLHRHEQFYATVFEHPGLVEARFVPGRGTVLTSADDGLIEWSLTGEIVQRLPLRGFDASTDGRGPLFDVSPDGRHVLLANRIDPPALLDLESGELVARFPAADIGWTSTVGFSPDGAHFVIADTSSRVILVDIQGKLVANFVGHDSGRVIHRGVSAVSFSADGKHLLTGADDQTAKLWDLAGNELQTFSGHEDYVESVAFSPDGQHVLTSSIDRTARVWTLDGSQIRVVESQIAYGRGAVFSPVRDMFLTVTDGSVIKLWDLQGDLVQSFKGHARVHSAQFSPDGGAILSAGDDGTARLWPIRGLAARSYVPGDCVHGGSIAAGGGFIVTESEQPNCLDQFGLSTAIGFTSSSAHLYGFDGIERPRLNTGGFVWSVAVSKDGGRIVTCESRGRTTLWEGRESGEVLTGVTCPAVFSPAGDRLIVASSDETSEIIDLADGSRHSIEGSLAAAAFSDDGQLLVTIDREGRAALRAAPGGSVITELRVDGEPVDVAFAPGSDRFVVATTSELEETTSVFDLPAVALLEFDRSGARTGVEIDAGDAGGVTVFYTSDELLVSVGLGTIRIYTTAGELVREYDVRGAAVVGAAEISSGRLLVIQSTKTIQVFGLYPSVSVELATGAGIATYSDLVAWTGADDPDLVQLLADS